MKTTISIAIFIAIFFTSFPIFSQEVSMKSNSIPLSKEESAIYLDSLKSVWVKIQNLPRGKKDGDFWSFDNYIIGTVGKVVDAQRHVITIDKDAHWDDGSNSNVSVITFYTYAKDSIKKVYFPLQVITFYYNYKDNSGMIVLATNNFPNDPELHSKTPEEIKEKINMVFTNLDKFI